MAAQSGRISMPHALPRLDWPAGDSARRRPLYFAPVARGRQVMGPLAEDRSSHRGAGGLGTPTKRSAAATGVPATAAYWWEGVIRRALQRVGAGSPRASGRPARPP